MSVPDILQFVYFVLPGFLSIEVYRAIYPARRHSDFVSIAWSLIYGVAITAFVFHWAGERFSTQLTGESDILPIRILLILIGVGIAVGLLRAGLRKTRFWLSQKTDWLNRIEPDSQSIWAAINGSQNEDWAIVFLTDGSIYRGYRRRFTFDPDAVDQDFLLSDASRVDEQLAERYPITGQGVYLRLRDVSRIEFLLGE